jgi:hypothetical protein
MQINAGNEQMLAKLQTLKRISNELSQLQTDLRNSLWDIEINAENLLFIHRKNNTRAIPERNTAIEESIYGSIVLDITPLSTVFLKIIPEVKQLLSTFWDNSLTAKTGEVHKYSELMRLEMRKTKENRRYEKFADAVIKWHLAATTAVKSIRELVLAQIEIKQ